MKIKHYLVIFCCSLLLFNCSSSEKTAITDKKEYNQYLALSENTSFNTAKKEFDFWTEKLKKSPSQYPYLSKIASANSQLFSAEGNIEFLIAAEKKLLELNNKTNFSKAGSLRALARNYVSQHRFNEALTLLKKAEINGQNLKTTHKMLFDVHLELGNYSIAENYLTKIKNLTDFGYLIRASKWNDHLGDLETAILFLEKATKMAESSNNKTLKIWTYTNLADYYGHHNEVKKSYNYYLKSLQLDPNNAYAKKGIAWIVYSYERKPTEALRILNTVMKAHQSPDYYLLRADIAEFMGKLSEKEKNISSYLSAVNNKLYGEMYNQYNINLYLDEDKKVDIFKLIHREIKNRATPQSYDLLAWAYYKKGDVKKSLAIVKKHIIGKTFEPVAQYHLAEIYKANGFKTEALSIKKELLESTYELGPLMELKIRNI